MNLIRLLPSLLLTACSGAPPAPAPVVHTIDHGLDDFGCDAAGQRGTGSPFWLDNDGDGYGDPDVEISACSPPPGTSRKPGDCDDSLASVHPEAIESCNGRDDDCDGHTDGAGAIDAIPWIADNDGDGWADPSNTRLACEGAAGWLPQGAEADCDDGDPSVHPGATERCNGIDDDCDHVIDGDEATDVVTWYRDADGDGFGDPLTTHISCEAPSGWVEPGPQADCDDSQAAVHPNADELCNGFDDDCDAMVDEDDALDAVPWYADTDGDRFGDPGLSVLSCRPPQGYVSSPGDCDDLRASSFLGADELCNGLDDNCDGQVDEDTSLDVVTWYVDDDGDHFGDPSRPRQACKLPRGHSATAGDCDDTRGSVHPESVEVCNGLDDDCDGAVDEPDADDAFTWYPDLDRDSYGDVSDPVDACYQPSGHVSPRGDCDDADPGVHPGASEPRDGIDNDCNGVIDDAPPGG